MKKRYLNCQEQSLSTQLYGKGIYLCKTTAKTNVFQHSWMGKGIPKLPRTRSFNTVRLNNCQDECLSTQLGEKGIPKLPRTRSFDTVRLNNYQEREVL